MFYTFNLKDISYYYSLIGTCEIYFKEISILYLNVSVMIDYINLIRSLK